MGTLERFAIAERMEVLAARIYRLFAEHHAHEAEIRALFERLAGEEDQHVQRVRFVRRHYRKDRTSVSSIVFNVTRAARVVEYAERLCEELATRVTTVAEARDLALKLEESFAQAHAEMITRDCPAELREFLESLARQDREHAKLLQQR